MKFDQLFPNATSGTYYKVPLPYSDKYFTMFRSPIKFTCESCHKMTHWFDKAQGFRACSTECRDRIIKKRAAYIAYNESTIIPLTWRNRHK